MVQVLNVDLQAAPATVASVSAKGTDKWHLTQLGKVPRTFWMLRARSWQFDMVSNSLRKNTLPRG